MLRDVQLVGAVPAVPTGCGDVFFSSRRRHTRYWRDWSSDVCSSDLVGVAAAPVVGREVLHALRGHLSREQAAPHRRVDDDAYVVLLAVREYLLLHLTPQHGVGRLEGLYRGYSLSPLHLGDVEVRNPDVPDLALLLQLGHRTPALLDVLVGPWPVDLVEVYYVGL